jgi:hypothetical protein
MKGTTERNRRKTVVGGPAEAEFDIEQHGGVDWRVFYVVAPDGLCYWFGERRAGPAP